MYKIVLTLMLGLVAATAVGFWYFHDVDTSLQGMSGTNLVDPSVVTSSAKEGELNGVSRLRELIELGRRMECTFTFRTEESEGEGAGFFDTGKARIDVLYTASSAPATASYMLYDASSTSFYSWRLTNDVMTGVKMPLELSPQSPHEMVSPPTAPLTLDDMVDLETVVTYQCQPWMVDGSVFIPPANVTFIDGAR